ncbi:MAG: hypothetical protein WBI88_10445, partial [Caldicoprobacterales bacterium]
MPGGSHPSCAKALLAFPLNNGYKKNINFMTFALIASRALQTQGFEIGAVATYAPRGDGSINPSASPIINSSRNLCPARGRKQYVATFKAKNRSCRNLCP